MFKAGGAQMWLGDDVGPYFIEALRKRIVNLLLSS